MALTLPAPLLADTASPAQGLQPRHFFQAALQQKRLAHAYILQGNRITRLYQDALWLAQTLNCQALAVMTSGTALATPEQCEPCGQCQACRWVAQNAHPAVMTLSPLTLQDEDSREKKLPRVITTAQVELLIHELGRQSGNMVRVIIVTDALPVDKATHAQPPGGFPLPAEWQEHTLAGEHTIAWQSLDAHVFGRAGANRLLKTLEEPPPKTVFLFLTHQAQRLLPTIVSRCQVVQFPYEGNATANQSAVGHVAQARQTALMDWLAEQGLQAGQHQASALRDWHAVGEAFVALVEGNHWSEADTVDVLFAWEAQQWQALVPTVSAARQHQQALKTLDDVQAMLAVKTSPAWAWAHYWERRCG